MQKIEYWCSLHNSLLDLEELKLRINDPEHSLAPKPCLMEQCERWTGGDGAKKCISCSKTINGRRVWDY